MGQARKTEFLEFVVSTSQNISLWKKKSEVDYFPLFVSLWLSLDAWIKDRFSEQRDRDGLELLKRGGHPLYDQFAGLIQANDAKSTSFKGGLGELHQALVNANISYTNAKFSDKKVGFDCCAIDWNNGQPSFESVLKRKSSKGKLQINTNTYVDDNPVRLFAAYMEIVYQVRCALFHGRLAPVRVNENVIKHIYLTLSTVMEKV